MVGMAWIRTTAALWSILCVAGICLMATAPTSAAENGEEVDPATAVAAYRQFVEDRAYTLPPAGAPTVSFIMTPLAQATLSDEAWEEFEKGKARLGQIMYSEALDHFRRAMLADPEHLEIRYIVAGLADYNSTKNMGDEALKDLQLAERAYVEAIELLRDRVERRGELQWLLPQMASMRYRIANRKTLDKLRHDAGLHVLQTLEQRRFERHQTRTKPRRALSEQEQQQQMAGMGGQAMGGGGMGMAGGAAAPQAERQEKEKPLETEWDALLDLEVLPPSERIYMGPPIPWKELNDELYDNLLSFGSFTGTEAREKAASRQLEQEMREAAKKRKPSEDEPEEDDE